MSSARVRELQPVIVAPGVGGTHEVLGDQLVVKLTGAQTAGAFSLFECTVPPGSGLPMHFHLHEDVLIIVKQGRLAVGIEGCETELAGDGMVFLPRGSIHSFRNSGAEVCRLWIMATPSGSEDFVARLAQQFAGKAAPPFAEVAGVCKCYGIHVVAPEADRPAKQPPALVDTRWSAEGPMEPVANDRPQRAPPPAAGTRRSSL